MNENKLLLGKLLVRLQELERENKKLKELLERKTDSTSKSRCRKPVMVIYQKSKMDGAGNRLCDNCEEKIGCRFHLVKMGFCSGRCLEEYFEMGEIW